MIRTFNSAKDLGAGARVATRIAGSSRAAGGDSRGGKLKDDLRFDIGVRRGPSMAFVVLLAAASLAVLAPAPPAVAAGSISVYMAGLNWPTALAFAPDGRIFFAERFTGNIRIIDGGTLLSAPFYTLANTATSGERGLLGLALDPDFSSSPYVYAYQTYSDAGNGSIYNRIVRILGSGNTGLSHSVILRMPPLSSATNHNGGVIAFGPDGRLHAVVGENADPALSQTPASPMGKVLRMNPDGSAPVDNPFYGSPTWNNLVFTYGHRNMFGLAFHPATGRAYVTENGPNCNDEVSLLTPGGNFGWGATATCSTPPAPPGNTNRDGPSPVLPLWWWSPPICPTNAAVYGGPYFPAWRGDLFMGDCNNRQLHRLDLVPPGNDSVASDTIIWTAPSLILDVEAGPDGAIWVTTPTTIYRYWDSARAPTASFTASPNPATVGAPVGFDASGSSDPDGTIVSYVWDFGDSSGGTGATTSHAYAGPGTYNVTLTVQDNESYTATAYRDVVVQAPPPGPQPPVAAFVAGPSPSALGVPVTFNASASFDPDGTIVSYTWDFGDGFGETGPLTQHTYAARGAFTVTLTVVDDLSLSNTSSRVVDVRNRAPRVTSSIPGPGAVSGVVVGRPRSFTVDASDADGDALSYAWSVDGSRVGGNASVLEFTAARPGTYLVNVTVSDGSLEDWRQWTVTVEDPVWVVFTNWWWWIVLLASALGAVLIWRIQSRGRPGTPRRGP